MTPIRLQVTWCGVEPAVVRMLDVPPTRRWPELHDLVQVQTAIPIAAIPGIPRQHVTYARVAVVAARGGGVGEFSVPRVLRR